MPKPSGENGEKNLISAKLKSLREKNKYSQRVLAGKLQLIGMDMDKNVITRIENNKRYVTDLELRAFVTVFDVTYEYLIEGKEGVGKI